MIDWNPLILTFKLALVTTIILFLIAIPIAYWLSVSKSKIKPIIETIISMPLVLPPTVIGFYLLLVFSPTNSFSIWLKETFDLQFVFSFEGLVLGSIIYSFPFMVHPIQSGFKTIPNSIIEAAYLLKKSKLETLLKVQLPFMKASLLTGIVLTFAHTIGEFGVVLMIGGNIPNQTKVASIMIYDEVEALQYDVANLYSIILFAITFVILLFVYIMNGKYSNKIVG
ncbi:molybdate ABC transporter permease subunit [Aureivirga sp. CE67]|uniref:molybdate ABC transporter permease subunit n=1 Tax=Aureivirga sp. CE67 TaxID=1788983 RepID=UPI0018CB5C4F|nr:molybdate ABC transporter permease subunit [Aureivirga sp. CE67]